MNDWFHFKLEFSPEHIWAIQIQRGRNGQLKFHRRIEAANFPGLTNALRCFFPVASGLKTPKKKPNPGGFNIEG